MRNLIPAIMIGTLAFAAGSCRSAKASTDQPAADTPQLIAMQPTKTGGPIPDFARPHAVIYRTNGVYNNNVFVNVAPDGHLLTFPAPSDVSADSAPVEVGNGWLLDRRGGISLNTVFLHITYTEYHALAKTPSPKEILADTIPGARVTDVRVLPVYASEAIANPKIVTTYLEN